MTKPQLMMTKLACPGQVMLLNMLAFEKEWPAMLEFGVKRRFNFSIAMDQGGC